MLYHSSTLDKWKVNWKSKKLIGPRNGKWWKVNVKWNQFNWNIIDKLNEMEHKN